MAANILKIIEVSAFHFIVISAEAKRLRNKEAKGEMGTENWRQETEKVNGKQ